MTLYKNKDIRKKERLLAIWRYHYPLYKLILGLWFDAFHGIQNFLGQWSVTVYWHNVNTDMLQYKFLHCSAWFITVESKQFICDMVKTLNWVRNGDTKYIVIGSHTSKNVWQKQKKFLWNTIIIQRTTDPQPRGIPSINTTPYNAIHHKLIHKLKDYSSN